MKHVESKLRTLNLLLKALNNPGAKIKCPVCKKLGQLSISKSSHYLRYDIRILHYVDGEKIRHVHNVLDLRGLNIPNVSSKISRLLKIKEAERLLLEAKKL